MKQFKFKENTQWKQFPSVDQCYDVKQGNKIIVRLVKYNNRGKEAYEIDYMPTAPTCLCGTNDSWGKTLASAYSYIQRIKFADEISIKDNNGIELRDIAI